MRILVLDETGKQPRDIVELLYKRKHDAVLCAGSNDFITEVSGKAPQHICLNVESWNHGKAIYNYLGITRKIENIPITFYNAPEEFNGLPNRPQHKNDEIIRENAEPQLIVDKALQSA